jgi:hypothetical protein
MNSDWNDDFKTFRSVDPIEPPVTISNDVLSLVRRDLNPSAWKVFSKLTLIHFVTALITLSFCPQFGIHLFGDRMGLMRVFMSLGEYGCLVACGSFFTGSSLLFASLFLRPEEVQKIRKYQLLELGTLTLLSLGFFVMLDAEFILGFTAAWIVGSVIGGCMTLELGWTLRKKAMISSAI